MTGTVGWIGRVSAFVGALIVGVVPGTVVQTQFNLLALQQLGVDISLAVRWSTTLSDLAGFAPLYGAMFGVSFLLSTLITGGLLMLLDLGLRPLFHALGAAVGLWVTFTLVDALAPPPTLIAATRSASGLGAMLITAAIAGALFAWLTARRAFDTGANVLVVGPMVVLSAGALVPVAEVRAQASMDYQVEEVTTGLEHPWSLAFSPNGGALITERAGRLRRLSANDELAPEAVSGVPEVFNSGQAGLFEVVFSPDYASNQMVFLSYACGSESANHLCVARGKLNEGALIDVAEIFRSQPPKQGDAHFGGRMAWLPDGSLVVTLGDGFDYREHAQLLSSHLGKVVRISPDGSVPDDNPFVGRSTARPEIYSLGHRNVQGLVYDPEDELLISHEHGPRGGDEINLLRPGVNYGWPVISYGVDYTGARITPFTERPGLEQPLLQWTPSIAPSGMTRYRGELFPQWQGDLFIGALAERSVHRVELVDGQAQDVEILFEELGARIRDVVTGPDGALYLLTDEAPGQVLRITPAP